MGPASDDLPSGRCSTPPQALQVEEAPSQGPGWHPDVEQAQKKPKKGNSHRKTEDLIKIYV